MTVALLVGAVLLSFAPIAAAEASMSFEAPSAPVAALAGLGRGNLTLTAPCAPAEAPAASVTLRLVAAPRWAQVTLSPATLVQPGEGCAGTWTANATVLVSATGDAPAFRRETLAIEAAFSDGSRLNASDVVEAGYFSILEVVPTTTSLVGEPQSHLAFPIRLTNLGNGPAKVSFEVRDPPAGWSVVAPVNLSVGAAQHGDRNFAMLTLMVLTPWRNGYVNEGAAIELAYAVAHSTRANLTGDGGTVILHAGVRGAYVPLPHALSLALLALAPLLCRR